MKKVIRQGVFETNSSSTHSIVFKNINEPEKSKIDYKSSFSHNRNEGIKVFSNLDKLLIILGSFNLAETDIQNELNFFEKIVKEKFPNIKETKQDIIDKLIEFLKRTEELSISGGFFYLISENEIFYISSSDRTKTISFEDVRNILRKLSIISLLGIVNTLTTSIYDKHYGVYCELFYCYTEAFNYYVPFHKFSSYEMDRKIAKKLKETLFEVYCDVESKSIDELNEELNKKGFNDNFTCCQFFCEHSLAECYCGFDSYSSIFSSLSSANFYTLSKKQLIDGAKRIFSNEFYFIIKETW